MQGIDPSVVFDALLVLISMAFGVVIGFIPLVAGIAVYHYSKPLSDPFRYMAAITSFVAIALVIFSLD